MPQPGVIDFLKERLTLAIIIGKRIDATHRGERGNIRTVGFDETLIAIAGKGRGIIPVGPVVGDLGQVPGWRVHG